MYLKFRGRHLGFFHFRFGHTVFPTIQMESWTQNLCNAVKISLISCRYAETQRLISSFYEKFYNFRFCGRHIGISDGDGHAQIVPYHSPDIFGESHWRISAYSMWFRNCSEKIGLGGTFTPPPPLTIWGLRSSVLCVPAIANWNTIRNSRVLLSREIKTKTWSNTCRLRVRETSHSTRDCPEKEQFWTHDTRL